MNSSTLTYAAASDLQVEGVRVRAPFAGLAALKAHSAPMSAAQGTTVSTAVFTINGTDVDVPGSPPREAPV